MVVRYANYDENGKITSTGICAASRFKKKLDRGERVVAGVADDRLHKIIGGKIVSRDNPEPISAIKQNTEPILTLYKKDWLEVLNRIEVLEKG